jgi:hypothetical protein
MPSNGIDAFEAASCSPDSRASMQEKLTFADQFFHSQTYEKTYSPNDSCLDRNILVGQPH